MNGISKYLQKQAKERLLKLYNESTKETKENGLKWYDNANYFCEYVAHNNIRANKDTFAKVVSCLSPSVKWETNKEDAKKLLLHFLTYKSIDSFKVSTYNSNKQKAWQILQEQRDLTEVSLKTYAFYRNIMLDENYITIDRWHLRACFKSELKSLTALKYRQVESLTLECAKEIGIKGYQFQAIVWEHIRTLNT